MYRDPRTIAFATSLLAAAPAACAEVGWYASATLGGNWRGDSDNIGRLEEVFPTGTGTTIPQNTPIPAGTALSWDTEFDPGWSLAPALGYAFGNGFAVEAEIPYFANDVDAHRGLALGPDALGSEDAAVLISGAEPLGTSVSALLADGRGDTRTIGYMANALYHFDTGTGFRPYVGAGLGVAETQVDFAPSGTRVVDADDNGFAWQVKAGVTYALSRNVDVFGEYRFFRQDEAEVQLGLLPGKVEVESEAQTLSAGVRFRF